MCLQGLASVSFILKLLPAALSNAAPLGVAVEGALSKPRCLSLEAEPGNLEVSGMLSVPLSAPISRAVLGISDNHGQIPCSGKARSAFCKHEGWLDLDEVQGWWFFLCLQAMAVLCKYKLAAPCPQFMHLLARRWGSRGALWTNVVREHSVPLCVFSLHRLFLPASSTLFHAWSWAALSSLMLRWEGTTGGLQPSSCPKQGCPGQAVPRRVQLSFE